MRPVLLFLFLPVLASAQIITVNPDGTADFTNIQSAINAAGTGDTVLVQNGVYTGAGNRNISFLGKAITVKSENGPDNCIIDGSTLEPNAYRGFIFNSNETRNSVLEGFTITGFWYKTCSSEGGAGIYIGYGSPTVRRCTIIDCTVRLDNCPGQLYGGGICVTRGSPLFENCIIRQNDGAYYGGGIACGNPLNPNGVWVFLENCLIAQNSASSGGGLSLYHYQAATITNCTVAGNVGYGLYCQNPPPGPIPGPSQFNENIVWQNAPAQTFGYYPQASRNYIQTAGKAEPRFVNPSAGDYHLQWDSPCINYGQYAVYTPGDLDFDGEPRLMGTYVDAGFDEVSPKQADFSRNGRIAMEDLLVLSAAWQTAPANSNWYLLCDLQKDNIINVDDLAVLAADWLWQADWFQE